MKLPVSARLLKIFYIVFAACFTLLLFMIEFFNRDNNFNPFITVFLTLICVAALPGIFYILKRNSKTCEHYGRWILSAFILIGAVIQIIIGLRLRYTPAWDMDAIYSGGIEWANTGAFSGMMHYFTQYPNNLGGLTLLNLTFRAVNLFGFTDYFAAAVIYNTVMIQVCVWAVYDSLKRLLGSVQAVFSLALFALFLPYWFFGAVFYTDLLSMPFIALTYNFYIRARASSSLRLNIIWFAAAAIAAAIGAFIKMTAAFIIIAIVIEEFFRLFSKNEKLRILPALGALALTFVLLFALNASPASKLDKEMRDAKEIPINHWIAMGLYGNGRYHPSDEAASWSTVGLDAKKARNAELIKLRLDELGVSGTLKLFLRKGTLDFGNGTLLLTDFLDDGPVNSTGLHQFLLYNGQYNVAYSHACQGIYLAMLLYLILGAVASAKARGSIYKELLAPRLAIFGLLLFLLIWESSARQISNYLPMILICAVTGVNSRFYKQ